MIMKCSNLSLRVIAAMLLIAGSLALPAAPLTLLEAQALLKTGLPESVQFNVLSVGMTGTAKADTKIVVSFSHRDENGVTQTGKAKIFVPSGTTGTSQLPLFYAAGYELDDANCMTHLMRGWVVVSTHAMPLNPLVRTASADIALLHRARSLSFIDDSRVFIGSGSAGGYMALMLTAETFPLAAAMPDMPVVNWGYNGAYFFEQAGKLKAFGSHKIPLLSMVANSLTPAAEVFGSDYGGETWFQHSPIGHISRITAPVSVIFSTADVLVPINQIGEKWVQPADAKLFPEGFTFDPKKLAPTAHGTQRLIESIPPDLVEVFEQRPPEGVVPFTLIPDPKKAKMVELPVSKKQWTVVIFDEGSPEPQMGHSKYFFGATRENFIKI